MYCGEHRYFSDISLTAEAIPPGFLVVSAMCASIAGTFATLLGFTTQQNTESKMKSVGVVGVMEEEEDDDEEEEEDDEEDDEEEEEKVSYIVVCIRLEESM